MNIAYLAAGAAGMYCGSCLRDNTLVAALRNQGHRATLIPTYTPLKLDEADVSLERVFYGGINVYLEQTFRLFRHTPWFIDWLFNRPALLRWTSQTDALTDGKKLAALTLSVLRGAHGHQRKELRKLIDWLPTLQPEVVNLPNAFFLGLCEPLKQTLEVPVVCSLTGEDVFLNEFPEAERREALELMRSQSQHADGFIATSRYFAEHCADEYGFPSEKIHVIYPGLNLVGHAEAPIREPGVFTVGYLARICPEKGLHLLCEAVHLLSQDTTLPAFRVKVGGHLPERHRSYLQQCAAKIVEWELADRFEYVGELDRGQKIEFLQSLSVLSVPCCYREPKGLPVLEALANGVPVVQPRHGAFPELIEATGGGLLVTPNDPTALAEALRRFMMEPDLRRQLGQQGFAAVRQRFTADHMAEQTVGVYQQCLDNAEKLFCPKQSDRFSVSSEMCAQ